MLQRFVLDRDRRCFGRGKAHPAVGGQARHRHAFTLIEVLLAIGIAAGILMVVLSFYRQAEGLRADLLQATSRVSAARVVMERLSQELSAARRSESFQQGLSGGSDNLRFVRLGYPRVSSWSLETNMFAVAAPAPSPFRLVSYSLVQDTNAPTGPGLLRSERSLTAPAAVTGGLTNEDDSLSASGSSTSTNGLAIEQLQFVRFRYYDGTNWLDSWSATDLPAGIEVSLGSEPLPSEMTADDYPFELYRRVIYLPSHATSGSLALASAGAKEGP